MKTAYAHILLIEAETKTGKYQNLHRLFDEWGWCDVTTVSGLAQADIADNNRSYDLILVDIILFGSPEFNLRTLALPIILLVTPDQWQDVSPALEKGASDYLLLPTTLTLLQARLNSYLQKQTQHQARTQTLRRYQRAIRIARQIQQGFFPAELPQPEGWELLASFQPSQEVAGDFYDAFPVTNGKIAFVIADVCDKGVPAALFMALIRSLLRGFIQQHYTLAGRYAAQLPELAPETTPERPFPPVDMQALQSSVAATNNYIYNNHRQTHMFATLFVGILDPATGSLIYINAGHNPPFLQRDHGRSDRLAPTGPAIGLRLDSPYAVNCNVLQPGDTLFAFTDGVTEARNPAGQQFTENCLLTLVRENGRSASQLITAIQAAVTAHCDTQESSDDITMLAWHYQKGSQ